jgi:hypothetical protein
VIILWLKAFWSSSKGDHPLVESLLVFNEGDHPLVESLLVFNEGGHLFHEDSHLIDEGVESGRELDQLFAQDLNANRFSPSRVVPQSLQKVLLAVDAGHRLASLTWLLVPDAELTALL